MPLRLSLEPVPNQTFSAQLEDVVYTITLKATRGVMSVSIDINGVRIISNSRFFSDGLLIPYEYLEGAGGNFIFTTELDAIPDFNDFGTTQFIYYLSVAELVNAR